MLTHFVIGILSEQQMYHDKIVIMVVAKFFKIGIYSYLLIIIARIKPRALHLLSACVTTELCVQQ